MGYASLFLLNALFFVRWLRQPLACQHFALAPREVMAPKGVYDENVSRVRARFVCPAVDAWSRLRRGSYGAGVDGVDHLCLSNHQWPFLDGCRRGRTDYRCAAYRRDEHRCLGKIHPRRCGERIFWPEDCQWTLS